MTALLAGVLLASLAGSAHCGGMCGPLVAVYAGLGPETSGRRRVAQHAAYSGGRLAGYASLGAAAGLLGAALDRAGALAGIGRVAAIVSGLLVLVSGVLALVSASGVGARHAVPSLARRLFGGVLRAAARRSALTRSALLGLGTALLPCGWLYAFVVTAAGTGRPLSGAIVMSAFWAGTLPVMIAFGETVRLVAGPMRRHVPRACAVLLIVLGLMTVFGRARVAPTASVPSCHEAR